MGCHTLLSKNLHVIHKTNPDISKKAGFIHICGGLSDLCATGKLLYFFPTVQEQVKAKSWHFLMGARSRKGSRATDLSQAGRFYSQVFKLGLSYGARQGCLKLHPLVIRNDSETRFSFPEQVKRACALGIFMAYYFVVGYMEYKNRGNKLFDNFCLFSCLRTAWEQEPVVIGSFSVSKCSSDHFYEYFLICSLLLSTAQEIFLFSKCEDRSLVLIGATDHVIYRDCLIGAISLQSLISGVKSRPGSPKR